MPWSIMVFYIHGDAGLHLHEVVLFGAAPGAAKTGSTCGSTRWTGGWVRGVLSITDELAGNAPRRGRLVSGKDCDGAPAPWGLAALRFDGLLVGD